MGETTSNSTTLGPLMVLIAATLWGTTGTAQAFAPEGAQPAAVGALRLLIGGAGLLALALSRGVLFDHKRWSLGTILVGAGAIAAYQLSFFAAVHLTGVAVGTIVGIGSAPIIAGVMAYFVRGEQLSRRWFTSTGFAIAGCALLLSSGAEIGVDALGVVLALGAGLSYSIYTLASKHLLEDHAPDAVMAVFFCLGALMLLPVLLRYNLAWVMQPAGLLVTLHLGLIATTLSYVFFARGLRTVPASTAVTLSLAEPLTAGLLGVLVVGEKLTPIAFVGIALLFYGLYLLTMRRRS